MYQSISKSGIPGHLTGVSSVQRGIRPNIHCFVGAVKNLWKKTLSDLGFLRWNNFIKINYPLGWVVQSKASAGAFCLRRHHVIRLLSIWKPFWKLPPLSHLDQAGTKAWKGLWEYHGFTAKYAGSGSSRPYESYFYIDSLFLVLPSAATNLFFTLPLKDI